MSRKATADVWWKNAVIYCVDIDTLRLDGDGIGDRRHDPADRLPRRARRHRLWLMPFYPHLTATSYDVTDLFGVDSGWAPMETSSSSDRERPRHPGLRPRRQPHRTSTRGSRRPVSKDNPYRDYYVWRSGRRPTLVSSSPTGGWHLGARREDGRVVPPPSTTPARLNFANPAAPRDRQVHRVLAPGGDRRFRVDACLSSSPTSTRRATMPRTSTSRRCGRSRPSPGDGILLGEVNLPHKEQRVLRWQCRC
jgi:hypothetical protein